jgi:small subunit ribosomal protein S14
MLKFNVKENKIRQKLYKNEIQNQIFKTIKPMLVKFQSKKLRNYLQNLTNKSSKYSSFTRTRTICILTGRTRSVYRFFRISRIKIREYANAGYFTGVTKAS